MDEVMETMKKIYYRLHDNLAHTPSSRLAVEDALIKVEMDCKVLNTFGIAMRCYRISNKF